MSREPQPPASSPAPSPGLLMLAAALGAGFAIGARWLSGVLDGAQLQGAVLAAGAAFAGGSLLFVGRVKWQSPATALRIRTRAGWAAAIALVPACAIGLALLGSGQRIAAAIACALPLAAAGCAYAADLTLTSRRVAVVMASWFAAAGVGLGAASLGLGAEVTPRSPALALAARATAGSGRFAARAAALALQLKPRGQGWDALGLLQSFELLDRSGRSTGSGALLRDFAFTAPLLRADHPLLRKTCETRALQLPGAEPRKRVLLAGVGGGIDLLCALSLGATRVDAVEPSAAQLRLVRGFIGAAGDDPRAHYYRAAPRVFARHARGYDLVVLDVPRSGYGLPPGLLPLPEATLMTTDGLTELLAALAPSGAMWASARGEPQALRLANSARAALQQLGVRAPEAQLAVHRMGEDYAITVARAPLDIDTVLALHRRTGSPPSTAAKRPPEAELLGLASAPELLFTPGAAFRSRFQTLLASERRRLTDDYVFDLSPASDDRPLWGEQTRRDRPDTWADSTPLVVLPRWLALAAAAALLALVATGRKVRLPHAATTALTFFGLGAAQALLYSLLNHGFGLFAPRPEQGLALAGLALPLLALATAPFSVAPAARGFAFAAQVVGATVAVLLAPVLVLWHGYSALGLCALGLCALAAGSALAARRQRASA